MLHLVQVPSVTLYKVMLAQKASLIITYGFVSGLWDAKDTDTKRDALCHWEWTQYNSEEIVFDKNNPKPERRRIIF